MIFIFLILICLQICYKMGAPLAMNSLPDLKPSFLRMKRSLLRTSTLTRRVCVVLVVALVLLMYPKLWPSKPKSAPIPSAALAMSVVNLSPDQPPKQYVQAAFTRTDKTGDQLLSVDELATWVFGVTMQAANALLTKNLVTFSKIDADRNGMVSWSEYVRSYLKTAKGIDVPPGEDIEAFVEKQERSIRGEMQYKRGHPKSANKFVD